MALLTLPALLALLVLGIGVRVKRANQEVCQSARP